VDYRFTLANERTFLALILPIAAYRRWRSVERAMETGWRLPDARVVPVVAGGVSIAVVSVLLS